VSELLFDAQIFKHILLYDFGNKCEGFLTVAKLEIGDRALYSGCFLQHIPWTFFLTTMMVLITTFCKGCDIASM
jgi:hypothetical protein